MGMETDMVREANSPVEAGLPSLRRILVTGGAGFIGSHFVRLLLRSGDSEVLNLDALRYSGNLENLRDVERHPRYTFIHGDICDRALVDRVAREIGRASCRERV